MTVLGGVTLVIEKGMHAGARERSNTGVLSVGSDINNDVVLLGDNLAAHHVSISVVDSWRGTVRIEAKDESILLQDGRIIKNGRYLDVAMPVRFQAGGAEFSVQSSRNTASLKRFAVPAIGLLALALVLPSIIGLVSGGMRRLPSPSSMATSLTPDVSPAALETWQEKLREKIRETGLVGQVSIERGASGNLVATGATDSNAADKWRDVLKWYDAQAAGPLLVNNVARGDTPTTMPSFRAVWVDARPQVVLMNGQSAGIGDLIPGGWKIESIEVSGVLLSRDGRTARVTY